MSKACKQRLGYVNTHQYRQTKHELLIHPSQTHSIPYISQVNLPPHKSHSSWCFLLSHFRRIPTLPLIKVTPAQNFDSELSISYQKFFIRTNLSTRLITRIGFVTSRWSWVIVAPFLWVSASIGFLGMKLRKTLYRLRVEVVDRHHCCDRG